MSEVVEMLVLAVEEQLGSEEVPFVMEHFERLARKPDIDEAEAKRMIAFCLADEMERMSDEKRAFDTERYRMLLEMLPAMPEGA